MLLFNILPYKMVGDGVVEKYSNFSNEQILADMFFSNVVFSCGSQNCPLDCGADLILDQRQVCASFTETPMT